MEFVAKTNYFVCTLIALVFSLCLIVANNQPIQSGVSTHPPTQTVVEGDNATFRCVIYNNTQATLLAIAWERIDSVGQVYHILGGPRYYFLLNTQILTITNVSVNDAGNYYCVAYSSNPDREERSNHSMLRVIEQATIDLPNHIEEVIGQNVTVNAIVSGGSHITLQKRKKSTGEFEDICEGKYSVSGSTITIYSLSAGDKGEYRACVYSLLVPSNTACTDFIITVTGFPFISLVPLLTVRNGSSCTITCKVTGPYTEDLQMTWQRVDGQPPVGQITQLSKTQLQLFIGRVTDTAHYQCIANNSLGISAMVTKIDVTSCTPNSPSITSLSCSNDTIHIAWNSADLVTAYIVQINKTTYRVPPSTNSFKVHGCKDITVLVTAKNNCGKSVPALATMHTTTCSRYTTATNTNKEVVNDQHIIIAMAVIFVISTCTLTIIIFISWRKIYSLKKQLIE